MGRCIFITGTDTGVGKTLLTCLLLHHFRDEGVHALAMKPFCSGGLEDVELLSEAMDGELSREEINPWFFPEPVAPMASSRTFPELNLEYVSQRVRALQARCEILLVEGAGGLCVPVNRQIMMIDLVRAVADDVILVCANKLGVINQTLLSAEALRVRGIERLKAVMMGQCFADASTEKNQSLLQELLPGSEVVEVNFLGAQLVEKEALSNAAKKIKKTLARVKNFDSFSPSSLRSE